MYLTGSRSQFPNEIDTIVEMFNIPLSYKPYVKEYQSLILKDNLTTGEREKLNELTVRLEPYIFNVEKWNKFGDVLINMQKFFKEGVEPYIENEKRKVAEHSRKQIQNITIKKDEAERYITEEKDEAKRYITEEKDEAIIHIDTQVNYIDKCVDEHVDYFNFEVGKFHFKGQWQPNIQYSEKNIVSYEGRGYIANKDNKGQTPDNKKYWTLIADKGDKGDPSLNINYCGDYDDSKLYTMGDAVVYKGLWYYAKKDTQGNNPINKEYWELSSHSVYIGDEPFDKRIPLWVKI